MATDTKARGKRTTPPPPKAPIPFYESPKLIAFMKWLIPFVMTGGGSGTAAYFATRHAETQAASRSEIQAMLDKSSAENRSYLTSELSSQNEKLAQRLAPIESNLTLIQKALRDYGTFVGGQGGEMLRDVTTPLKEMRSLSEFAIRSASKKDLPETQGFLAAILPTLKNEHENNTAIAKAAHIFTHNALCSVADDLPATKPLVRTIQTLLITRLKDEGIKAQPFERVVISPEVRSSLPTSIRLGMQFQWEASFQVGLRTTEERLPSTS